MSTSQAQPTKRTRNRRFKLVAVLLAVTVFFIVPEVLVRLFSSSDQSSYSAIKFGGDRNSPDLFVKDSELHWTLRKNAEVEFLGHTANTDAHGFRIGRPRGAIDGYKHVLCVGDSTTFGWRVAGKNTFTDLLESSLNEKQPNQKWMVHNTGVPGYSSHQMRQTAERWIPKLKPQIVVICIGNNDAWPSRVSDLAAQKGGFATGLANLLGKSAFLSWTASLLRGEEAPENPIYFANDSVPRVSDDEMAANVEAVIAIAKQHSARVLMLGAPANLHFPPRNMNAEIDKHRALGDRISAEINNHNAAVATRLANDALAKDPSHIYLQWLRAMVTALVIDEEQGRVELEAVFERHRYPDRARETYRKRQQQVAEDAGVPFADVNALFLANREPEEARKLYVDWCHPSAAGHRIMALQLLQWIAP
ncbi:MAG: lysophospholipase L1-like esterase [Planctomycetota bacterium]|jgi:lysophospholipase L1-like esterase